MTAGPRAHGTGTGTHRLLADHPAGVVAPVAAHALRRRLRRLLQIHDASRVRKQLMSRWHEAAADNRKNRTRSTTAGWLAGSDAGIWREDMKNSTG